MQALRRFFWGSVGLLGMSFLSFVLIYYSQGSVAFSNVSQGMSPALKLQIEENLGVNQPLMFQYKQWLLGVISGDFSTSLISGEKVTSILQERLPNTLILGGISFFLLFVLSLIFGVVCLFSKSFDRIFGAIGMSIASLPIFSLALLAILIFSAEWAILPSSGVSDIGMEEDLYNRFLHLILPVGVLVISHLGGFTQFVRTTLFDSLNQGFIQFGLARGLSLFYIYTRWVLKYALSPIVAYFSASFVSFMIGTYVVEGVFSYGGIGESLIRGIIFKDYPLIMAILMLSFLVVLCVNFVADCLCAWLNRGRI